MGAEEEKLRDVVLTEAPKANGGSEMTKGEALTTKGIGTCSVGQLNKSKLAPDVKVVHVPKNGGDSLIVEATGPCQAAKVSGVVMKPAINSPDQFRKVSNLAKEDASTKVNGSNSHAKSNSHDFGICSSLTDLQAPVDVRKLIESAKLTQEQARAEDNSD